MKYTYRPRAQKDTSYLMSRVRSKDSVAELALRRQLHSVGLRFRKDVRSILGRPDIVFPKERVAIFVDGDFWHARILKERGLAALASSLKTNNRAFWLAKLQGNASRDVLVTTTLQEEGWHVVRFWESEVKKATESIARKIAILVARKRRATGNVAGRLRALPPRKRLRKHPVPARQRTSISGPRKRA